VDDIMKQREEESEEAPAATAEEAGSTDEEEPTPQLEEAIRVLSDLVSLSHQRAAAREASRPES
jgi:hypothetical protein